MSPSPKPSNIFRRLTTKFTRTRTRSTSPPPAKSRRLSSDNNATSPAARAARDAALRERGLLPALPLSVQEAQWDSRIAIVASPEPGEEYSSLARQPTAASKIKDEWKAKAHDAISREVAARTRLTEFRFGGASPVASPLQETFPPLDPVAEADSPFPSPLPSPRDFSTTSSHSDDAVQAQKIPKAPPPTLNLSRGRNLSPPLLQAWSDLPPDSAALPPPPSPAPVTEREPPPFSSLISAFASDAGMTPITPAFLPLPPSPSPGATSSSFVRGVDTPRSPAAVTPARHRDSSLPPSESASDASSASRHVPSLVPDSASASSAASTSAFELTVAAVPVPASAVGRMRSVKVRNSIVELGHSAEGIEVIVETPREERGDPFSVGVGVGVGVVGIPEEIIEIVRSASPEPIEAVRVVVSDDADTTTMPESKQVAEPVASPSLQENDEVDDVADLPTPRRSDTAPTLTLALAPGGRRKGGFLGSIRRSVGIGRSKTTAGTASSASRPASAATKRKSAGPAPGGAPRAFNAALLPPSSTLASIPNGGGGSRPVSRLSVSAVNPTMHSTGSIVQQTSAIADEESRRMTELAFM